MRCATEKKIPAPALSADHEKLFPLAVCHPPPRFGAGDFQQIIGAAGDYCMINPDIWQRQLGLGWDDNLCIACIEKRLGRKLKGPIPDFCSWASVEGFPASATLQDRFRLNELKYELKRKPRRWRRTNQKKAK